MHGESLAAHKSGFPLLATRCQERAFTKAPCGSTRPYVRPWMGTLYTERNTHIDREIDNNVLPSTFGSPDGKIMIFFDTCLTTHNN